MSEAAADLRHVSTWLFDLDNTLYPLESGLAAQASDRITDYVERLTGLPREEAQALQKRYLAEHGLTLRGLMSEHGVDPDEYHARIAVEPDCLVPDDALRAGLARLPGRRIIFTNADAAHAERVLERLAVADLFDEVFHIASAAFIPKPSRGAFERILAAHAIAPRETAFFEDSERNLEPAAELGMTTVLVGPYAEASTASFVHHRASDLAAFLAQANIKEIP
ncbi:MAG TPA: pyrimidine 5'-nucleotidase [Caulobacteraceae bacterium]|jgi:putative hydrolase of the HAD superfamily